jgi:hypothetical protein
VARAQLHFADRQDLRVDGFRFGVLALREIDVGQAVEGVRVLHTLLTVSRFAEHYETLHERERLWVLASVLQFADLLRENRQIISAAGPHCAGAAKPGSN